MQRRPPAPETGTGGFEFLRHSNLRVREPSLVAVIRTWLRTIVLLALVVALVLGIADGIAADGPQSTANSSAFQAASALVADDAAQCRTAEPAYNGTGLGIGPGCTRGGGNCHNESK